MSLPWIDVSVPLRTGMVTWPGDPPVRITAALDLAKGDEATVSLLSMGAHTGTHMDAPRHFLTNGPGIDAMPPEIGLGRARVLAIPAVESIQPESLRPHRIRRGERILFRTRNSDRPWGDGPFVEDFVHISPEGAAFLVQRGVRLVGIDYLSVGGFKAGGAETHRTLLGAGIWIIEGLNLASVKPGSYDMACLPLRILKRRRGARSRGPAASFKKTGEQLTMNPLEFGVVGLGRMGGNLAHQALEKGMRVVGYELRGAPGELLQAGLVEVRDLGGFREALARPRVVLLYIPAGPVVDRVLTDLAARLEENDILVDGGNSYWGDSIRRHSALRGSGLHLVDLGTSGGVDGARHGACFMAGGEAEPVRRVLPILEALATPGGVVHAGPPGAGHFTKLVHNGIEFGMLQAIGEGIDLLEHYRDKLDVAEVLRCWRHGSVVRSWLVDLMEQAYRSEGGLDEIPAYVEDTGEVNWLVDDALHMEVPIPVISQAVMQLFTSRDERKNWARAIAMMRHGFGGHPYGADAAIVKERRGGRVGGFQREDT